MKLPKNSTVLFRIVLENNENILYLKDIRKFIFTDEAGYFWSKEKLCNEHLENVRIHFKNAFIKECSVDEYMKHQQNIPKGIIKVSPDGETGKQNNIKKKEHINIDMQNSQTKYNTTSSEILNETETETESDKKACEEFEKRYWGELNDLCMSCNRGCKQSSKVTIWKCPQYSKKGV